MVEEETSTKQSDHQKHKQAQKNWGPIGLVVIAALVLLAVIGFSLSYLQDEENVELKRGFINKSGELVAEPEFDNVDNFSDGLAKVVRDGKVGFINREGKIVFKPVFNKIIQRTENMVKGQIGRGKLTLLPRYEDLPGERFSQVSDLNKPPIRVKMGNKWGFVDNLGEFIVKPKFSEADLFENQPVTRVRKNGTWGLLNQSGELVVDTVYERLTYLGDEIFKIGMGDREGLAGPGGLIIKPKFQKIKEFQEGLAPVKQDGKWGYVNKQGEIKVEPQFEAAAGFSDGRARIGVKK